MSLGTVTLDDLRNMVRSKLRRYGNIEFDQAELDRVINNKVYEIFLGMDGGTKRRLYTTAHYTVPMGWGPVDNYNMSSPVPSDYFDHIAFHSKSAMFTNVRFLHAEYISPEDLALSWEDEISYGYYTIVSQDDGAGLLRRVCVNQSMIQGYNYFIYIRKPEKMASESSVLDLPDEYISVLILLCASDLVTGIKLDTENADVSLQALALSVRDSWRNAGLFSRAEEGGA